MNKSRVIISVMSYIEHYTLVKQASAFDVFNNYTPEGSNLGNGTNVRWRTESVHNGNWCMYLFVQYSIEVLRILKMKALVEFGLSNMSKFVGKQQNISILIATKNSKSFNIRGWNRAHCKWAGALKLCSGATLRVILSSM